MGLFLGPELHSYHSTTLMRCLVHAETSQIPWEWCIPTWFTMDPTTIHHFASPKKMLIIISILDRLLMIIVMLDRSDRVANVLPRNSSSIHSLC